MRVENGIEVYEGNAQKILEQIETYGKFYEKLSTEELKVAVKIQNNILSNFFRKNYLVDENLERKELIKSLAEKLTMANYNL